MERITISLDEALAREFDALIERRGYRNRSEAIRDLLRAQLEAARSEKESGFCIANLSYVYDHHARDLAERLTCLQHAHHDLTVATMHVHLDHDDCMESVILRGPTSTVREFANAMIAERGVRHGQINIVSVDVENSTHVHGYRPQGGRAPAHLHLKPKS
ncbi:MAG: nickel-responsive transcriptional regulator NikR [Rhodocyclaceae bacterium]